MAQRELESRLQLAEQQILLYREATRSLRERSADGGRNCVGPASPSQSPQEAPPKDETHFVAGAESPSVNRIKKKGSMWGFIEDTVSWIAHSGIAWEEQRLAEEVLKVRRRRASVEGAREVVARRSERPVVAHTLGEVWVYRDPRADLFSSSQKLLDTMRVSTSGTLHLQHEIPQTPASPTLAADLARCRMILLRKASVLDSRRSQLAEACESCRVRRRFSSEQLVKAMSMGALNDCFHIWHRGPFATINGFRVGRLSGETVDWQEVNAGVGQAAIVLVTVALAMGIEFSKYLIAPCGSFTRIARSEDGRVLYNLHTDESFSLFPKRNFNMALKAFLHCLGEVGERVQDHDPTLQLPYRIKDGTVGGLSVALGSSLEDWTRAMKYMITDLKWIVAWAAKYLPPC